MSIELPHLLSNTDCANGNNFKKINLEECVRNETIRIKDISISVKDGTHGSFDRVENGFPLLSAKNIKNGGLIVGEFESKISQKDHHEIIKNGAFKRGDVLMSIVGTLGSVSILNYDNMAFQRSVASIRTNRSTSNRYIYWCLTEVSISMQIQSMVKTTAQSGLYLGDVKRLLIWRRIYSEQIAIADYLDKTTALIDKQRALLERKKALLQEYKKSLIHEAVTKGLDPSVPMKNSGVDWIGEVPNHWDIRRVKDVCKLVMGQSPESGDVSDLIVSPKCLPFLQGCSEFGASYPSPEKYCSEYSKVSMAGDVLFSVRAPVGRTNLADQKYVIGRGLCSLRATSINSSYINWVTQSVIAPSMSEKVTGSTFEAVSVSDVKTSYIPIPPIEEQRVTASRLSVMTELLDQQISLIEQKMKLLVQLRSSLIHEAVTKGVPSATDVK